MPQTEGPGTWESRYRDQLKLNPGSIGIIAEGDSWFAFPQPLRTNLIAELDALNGPATSLWSIARNGDTAQEIMFGQQFSRLRQLFSDATLEIDAFLFSAGGNDLVGDNLSNFLNTFQEGMQWMDCINMPFLDLRFRDVQAAYQRLADLRDAYKEKTYIFTHAYDWACPSGGAVRVLWLTFGGWLKKQFQKKGIRDNTFQEEIITYLLDRFGKLMERFEMENKRVIYVRTQGTLNKDTDWGDELHPTSAGFRKIAAKFQNSLRTVFSDLPKP
jgi:lysophospholipase L1-like esterase